MASSTGTLPIVAPDRYGSRPGDAGYLSCPGAEVLTLTVNNSAIVWQLGVGNPPYFETQPEAHQPPAYRSMRRRVDAIRFRAAVPLAQLPAGQTQATVAIDTAP